MAFNCAVGGDVWMAKMIMWIITAGSRVILITNGGHSRSHVYLAENGGDSSLTEL